MRSFLAFALVVSLAPVAASQAPQSRRVERVSIERPSFGAYVGTSIPLSARVYVAGDTAPAKDVRIDWQSTNSSVAWVTDQGVVQFLKSGKVTVRARAGTIAAETSFDVRDNPVKKIAVRAPLTDVAPGDTIRLAADVTDDDGRPVNDARVTWALVGRGMGTRPSGVSLTPDGRFVAQFPGTYVVLATIGPVAHRSLVRVKPTATVALRGRRAGGSDAELKLSDPDYIPYVGTSFPLKALLFQKGIDQPMEQTNILWSTDAPDVAAISFDGTVTFLKPGKVTISADDGVLQLTKRYTVQPNPSARLVMVSNAGDVRVGDSVRVNVQIWARGGMPVKNARPNFAILREDGGPVRAAITENNVFVAQEPGVYTILVEMGGLTDRATVVVRKP